MWNLKTRTHNLFKGNVNCCGCGKKNSMRIWTVSSSVYFPTEWLNSHRETWHLMFKHEGGGSWWRELCNVNTGCTWWTFVLSDVLWLGKKKCPEIIYTDCVVFVQRTRPLGWCACCRKLFWPTDCAVFVHRTRPLGWCACRRKLF